MHERRLRRLKILLFSLWAILFCSGLIWWLRSNLQLDQVPALLAQALDDFGFFKAALLYMLIYAVRPFTFFPATLLTLISGLLFGPWWGILFTMLGENASANVAFMVGRWLGRDWVSHHERPLLQRLDQRLSENAVVSVMIMRLIFLPFDPVSYTCGLSGMRQRDFALGTAIGITPSLIGIVLLGGAASGKTSNSLWIYALSGLFILFGLALARYYRPQSGAN